MRTEHRVLPALIYALIFFIAVVITSNTAFATAASQADSGAPKQADASPLPDDRYKADILVVIAHPDDETLISGYLAKAALDDGKRVDVVFTTRGNAGDNEVGYEQAAALADMREIEARQALASIGITNVWFLDAPDTPARDIHNVLRSLETANHGATVQKIVRFMRLTRPGVVITFLPSVVVGENHEDHQASGVMATEAFDLAGDPTRFAEQVSFPDDRTGYGNLTEGLRPWQPQKLYYFSDASHTDFLKGKGLEFAMTGTSASRHVPYYRLKAIESSYYLTQIGVGADGVRALKTGDFSEFDPPEFFVLGKSTVKASVSGDLVEGVSSSPVSFAPVRGYQPPSQHGVSVELGDPWSFYGKFWKAHNLDQLADLLPVPEIGIGGGALLPVQVLIHNDTDQDRAVTLRMTLPAGWTEKSGTARYPVRAHDVYPVRVFLLAPPSKEGTWHTLRFYPDGDAASGSADLRVYVGKGPE